MAEESVWQTYMSAHQRQKHSRWFEAGRTGDGRINVERKNLSRANCDGGYFQGARFVRCDLSESDISSGNLRDSEIVQCIWDDALLYSVNFDRSLIQDCRIVAAYLGIGDFIETQVKGGDWSKSDFHRSAWTNARVENVCFRRANFQAARLWGTKFVNCDFREANLLVATPHDAVFEHCDFRGANLQELSIKNTVFDKCCFHGCVGIPEVAGDCQIIEPDLAAAFDGSLVVDKKQLFCFWGLDKENTDRKITTLLQPAPEWEGDIGYDPQVAQAAWVKEGCTGTPPIYLEGKNLSQAFLYQAYLISTHLVECNLASSDLRRARLHQAKLINCILDRALLMNALATETLFQDCQVNQANVNRFELEKAQIIGGNWSDSEFNNCILHLSKIENVCFGGSSWRWADLRGTHFINCDFRGADLTDANLIGSVFERCDFRDAEISWAKLKKTTFEQCGFSGVIGNVLDWDFESEYESLIINPDLSENFDGTDARNFTSEAKKFFSDLSKKNQVKI